MSLDNSGLIVFDSSTGTNSEKKKVERREESGENPGPPREGGPIHNGALNHGLPEAVRTHHPMDLYILRISVQKINLLKHYLSCIYQWFNLSELHLIMSS